MARGDILARQRQFRPLIAHSLKALVIEVAGLWNTNKTLTFPNQFHISQEVINHVNTGPNDQYILEMLATFPFEKVGLEEFMECEIRIDGKAITLGNIVDAHFASSQNMSVEGRDGMRSPPLQLRSDSQV